MLSGFVVKGIITHNPYRQKLLKYRGLVDKGLFLCLHDVKTLNRCADIFYQESSIMMILPAEVKFEFFKLHWNC